MPYQNIVFMQSDDADEALRILYDKHDDSVVWSWPDKVTETIEHLTQWDMGEGEVNETSQSGSADDQKAEGNYILTWHLGLGYIGLERIVPSDEWLDIFTASYAVTMLWANTHSEDGEAYPEHGEGMSAFNSDSQASVTADCRSFAYDCWSDLQNLDAGQCGHDFALTRNGHGAGFWDRGLGEVGQRLTEASKPYGEVVRQLHRR
jgi:hypothetical protein